MSTEQTEAQNQMDTLPNTISLVKKKKKRTNTNAHPNITLYRRDELEICGACL